MLHFGQGKIARILKNATKSIDAEHFSIKVEILGQSIGVDEYAFAGTEGHLDGCLRINSVVEQTEDGAVGLLESRRLAPFCDHCWRMTGTCKLKRTLLRAEACCSHCEIERRTGQVVYHKVIELLQHGSEFSATLDERHRLRVDPVRYKRGTYAVP